MYSSLLDGFSKIKAGEGTFGLALGWFPTLVGYSL